MPDWKSRRLPSRRELQATVAEQEQMIECLTASFISEAQHIDELMRAMPRRWRPPVPRHMIVREEGSNIVTIKFRERLFDGRND